MLQDDENLFTEMDKILSQREAMLAEAQSLLEKSGPIVSKAEETLKSVGIKTTKVDRPPVKSSANAKQGRLSKILARRGRI